ncbi:MAG: cytochrome P450 [Novosphingobium sp.]|nr:cytochrome P450 [Novosphingobium sp.]
MNRFVEEFLRIEPAVQGLSRMTTWEVELGGRILPKGAHLLLYGSGNMDEAAFPDPLTFDPTRPNVGSNVTFGGGAHRSVGLALALMEVKVAAEEIIRRLDDFQLAVPAGQLNWLPDVSLRALDSLPISFSRRETT